MLSGISHSPEKQKVIKESKGNKNIWKWVQKKNVANRSRNSGCAGYKFWEITMNIIKKPDQYMYCFCCFLRTGNNCKV